MRTDIIVVPALRLSCAVVPQSYPALAVLGYCRGGRK
jgi:hypothetical protein